MGEKRKKVYEGNYSKQEVEEREEEREEVEEDNDEVANEIR